MRKASVLEKRRERLVAERISRELPAERDRRLGSSRSLTIYRSRAAGSGIAAVDPGILRQHDSAIWARSYNFLFSRYPLDPLALLIRPVVNLRQLKNYFSREGKN